jgi:hypothetical protein
MGLRISVYRDASHDYDCTNNGVSRQFNKLTVMNIDGPFDPSDDAPAVLLDSHYPGCLRLIPALKTALGWVPYTDPAMFGGNLGYTSDSRFPEACEKLLGHTFYGAVKIHDRFETQQQTDYLSR